MCVCICHIHIYVMEYSSAIKKNEILPFATTWMDQDSIMLSQSEKDKHPMSLLVRGIYFTEQKKQTKGKKETNQKSYP